MQGCMEVVKILLDAGASPNSRFTVRPWPNDINSLSNECVDGADCSREATAANNVSRYFCLLLFFNKNYVFFSFLKWLKAFRKNTHKKKLFNVCWLNVNKGETLTIYLKL